MLTLLLMGYDLIQEALDKMSFWQKIKIVGRHSLQKIFAYLMVLSLLLIFARVWC